MSRSSRQAFLASSTISGFTSTPFTLLAARSTTAIHVRSFPTVAGPAPLARRDRAWSMSVPDVRLRTSDLPMGCFSRNSSWHCFVRCHFDTLRNESMYQRIKLASVMSPSCALTRAVGSSSSTSRALAHFSAAARREKVLDSRWTSFLPLCKRMVAMYPTEPSERRLGRIVAIEDIPGCYMAFM